MHSVTLFECGLWHVLLVLFLFFITDWLSTGSHYVDRGAWNSLLSTKNRLASNSETQILPLPLECCDWRECCHARVCSSQWDGIPVTCLFLFAFVVYHSRLKFGTDFQVPGERAGVFLGIVNLVILACGWLVSLWCGVILSYSSTRRFWHAPVQFFFKSFPLFWLSCHQTAHANFVLSTTSWILLRSQQVERVF